MHLTYYSYVMGGFFSSLHRLLSRQKSKKHFTPFKKNLNITKHKTKNHLSTTCLINSTNIYHKEDMKCFDVGYENYFKKVYKKRRKRYFHVHFNAFNLKWSSSDRVSFMIIYTHILVENVIYGCIEGIISSWKAYHNYASTPNQVWRLTPGSQIPGFVRWPVCKASLFPVQNLASNLSSVFCVVPFGIDYCWYPANFVNFPHLYVNNQVNILK